MYSVCQIGARMGYAVPAALNEAKMLSRFYTDITADRLSDQLLNMAGRLPGLRALQRLGYRKTALPEGKVVQFPWMAVRYDMMRRFSGGAVSDITRYLWAEKTFSKLVSGLMEHDSCDRIYSMNTASLGIMQNRGGRMLVLEQCSLPYGHYLRLIGEEEDRYPQWSTESVAGLLSSSVVQEYCSREIEELKGCDRIIAPSGFVKDAILQYDVGLDKIYIVPYGYSFAGTSEVRNLQRNMKVAMVGEIALRKGIHHFSAIAGRFNQAAFFAFGKLSPSLPERRVREMNSKVTLTGHLDRGGLFRRLQEIDVMMLLTLGEGSATSVYEAMALGIPVITTPECGSVIEDGVSGFIVDRHDHDQIADRLEKLSDPGFYRFMSEACLKRSTFGSRESYGRRLVEALRKI